MTYYCPKCQKDVLPTQGEFQHPHLGIRLCYVCPHCGGMVYPKDDKTKEVA